MRKSLPDFKFDNQILNLRIALQVFRITSGRGGGLGVVASRMEARVRAAGVSPFRLVVNPWTQSAGTEGRGTQWGGGCNPPHPLLSKKRSLERAAQMRAFFKAPHPWEGKGRVLKRVRGGKKGSWLIHPPPSNSRRFEYIREYFPCDQNSWRPNSRGKKIVRAEVLLIRRSQQLRRIT